MTTLTETDREKLNRLVGALFAQTEAGKIDWERATSGEHTWTSARGGTVYIAENRIRVRSFSGAGRPAQDVVDEVDFPGVDHLWALVDTNQEERSIKTINAILRDLDRLETQPVKNSQGDLVDPRAYATPPPPDPRINKPPTLEERGIPVGVILGLTLVGLLTFLLWFLVEVWPG